MHVSIVNDGPVTIYLDSEKEQKDDKKWLF